MCNSPGSSGMLFLLDDLARRPAAVPVDEYCIREDSPGQRRSATTSHKQRNGGPTCSAGYRIWYFFRCSSACCFVVRLSPRTTRWRRNPVVASSQKVVEAAPATPWG